MQTLIMNGLAGAGAVSTIYAAINALRWLAERRRIAQEQRAAVAFDAEAEQDRLQRLQDEVSSLRDMLERKALPPPDGSAGGRGEGA